MSPGDAPLGNPFSGNPELAALIATNMAAKATEQADGTIASITATVLDWITSALEAADNQARALAQKILTQPIQTLNAAEQTADSLKSYIKNSATGAVQGATSPAAPGGSVDQGVQAGQYPWEFWSPKTLAGWDRPQLLYKPGALSPVTYCFRGGYQEVYDALNAASSYAPLGPGACPLPGGPAIPPIGSQQPGTQCDAGVYHTWQRANQDGTYDCVELCQGVPGPPGYVDQGQTLSPGANAPVGTVYSCQGTITPPTTGMQYDAGCVGGAPVSWQVGTPAPQGVSGQVGPFADPATAIAALGTSCSPTGGGPPTPTPTPTPSAGQCCDTNVTKLPDCIYIDLCDWEKFYDATWRAIKKGLCEWILDPQCQCATRDSDRYLYEDCDGTFGPDAEQFMGRVGGTVTQAGSIDQMVATARDTIAGILGGINGSPPPR